MDVWISGQGGSGTLSDGEAVKFLEDGCDVFLFSHSHQDPGGTVLE